MFQQILTVSFAWNCRTSPGQSSVQELNFLRYFHHPFPDQMDQYLLLLVSCLHNHSEIVSALVTLMSSSDNFWDFRFSRRRVWRLLSSWLFRRVVWYKFTDVSEVLAAYIIRASTSETSVSFYQIIWRNIPEDSHLRFLVRDWIIYVLMTGLSMSCLVFSNVILSNRVLPCLDYVHPNAFTVWECRSARRTSRLV
jgi:hypothetical protein